MTIPFIEENDQTIARREHLEKLRAAIGNVYPNKFARTKISGAEDTISSLVNFAAVRKHIPQLEEGARPAPEAKEAANLELKKFGNVRVAGRLATPPRLMGKAAFVHLSDGISRIQIYAKKGDFVVDAETRRHGDAGSSAQSSESADSNLKPKQEISASPRHRVTLSQDASWEVFGFLDHGDFVGVEGFLFITNTGELSIHVEKLQFLAKAMLPMPDKVHGVHDAEIRQRRRYVDLIGSSLQIQHEGLTTREVFEVRAKTISSIRNFLESHGYVEVETPMLTPKATGAAAKPFVTHHNALDIELYARIAPELYLKRLLVGGFEKVYELNRNFRNEGISFKHNPEFTMLEFYCAYMDVNGMMDFCEEILRDAVKRATGGLKVKYEENEIDFSNIRRVSMRDAISERGHKEAITNENLVTIFEEVVEPNLIQPTFIVDFPKAISPLSKASPENPQIAERFELFINGMEVANGFSELNDPQEQYERFLDQQKVREGGDEEAMLMDEDYVRALAYGMPPAAGIGIGIDRLVMLLTDKHSIRDVILFPHLRPERSVETEES